MSPIGAEDMGGYARFNMVYSLTSLLLVAAILLASSVLQGAVGFASGLFGIPLLMLTGVSLPEAVAISLVAAAVQNCTAAWQLRHEIDYRGALRPMLIRFATMPLGVWALVWIGEERKDEASQLVGLIVLSILVIQWSLRVPPQPKLHAAWEWLAFGLGGFLLGLCGMGGPPMVLWTMAHDWPMVRARAFLYYIFATGLPLQALLLWAAFGGSVLWAMGLGLALAPVLLLGTHWGLALGRRMPERLSRVIATVVLLAIAASAIALPWLR
ncbi:MAG: sulfite exporter TauE/SafE family protein [Planctomycetaceae bacterium]|nr:sulfite exporter TauE/SafE family protein [Planctomycetaceae bacterium]